MKLAANLLIVLSILIFVAGALGLNWARTPNVAYGSASITGIGAAIAAIGLVLWLCG